MSRLEIARKQIEFARAYTISLIEDIEPAQWFHQPGGAPTHVAWQVGHLTMAQYMLTLFRLRGKQESDGELIPRPLLKRFLKGTVPEPEPAAYPPVEELRATFDRVHQQLLQELPASTEEQLQTAVVEPYMVEPTVLGSLFFSAAHEMMHAGQIGLLRRLLGKSPRR